MGLISRVSSRTYRFEHVEPCRQKSVGFLRPPKRLLLWWLWPKRAHKNRYMCLHHNKNGNIRYAVYQAQFTDYRISGNMMLAGTFGWLMFALWFNLLRDDMFFTIFHAFPGHQADNLRKLGITPNLDDHSYGTWNYYPTCS